MPMTANDVKMTRTTYVPSVTRRASVLDSTAAGYGLENGGTGPSGNAALSIVSASALMGGVLDEDFSWGENHEAANVSSREVESGSPGGGVRARGCNDADAT